MKRYYSKTIPVELAIKLQDAGMKVEWQDNTPIDYSLVPDWRCLTMYGEVLDWLMERGLDLAISRKYTGQNEWWSDVLSFIDKDSIAVQSRKNDRWLYTPDWFEAANEGIETALKILKEGKK